MDRVPLFRGKVLERDMESMKTLEKRLEKHIDALMEHYPLLEDIRADMVRAYFILEESYENGGKLLIAGNGGSAADAGHIAAELMKRFHLPRPVNPEYVKKLLDTDPVRGAYLAEKLEQPLTALALDGHGPLATAYSNDVGSHGVFAQQLLGYGRCGDVFLGISTSGSSRNVIYAAVAARALGMPVIALTGRDGGELAAFADMAVRAPADETDRVQELHLPIYHCWCRMLEDRFFAGAPDYGTQCRRYGI